MKNTSAVIILWVFLLLILSQCNGKMAGLPKYLDKECYYDEHGFMDADDYCKYYYNEETIKKFEKRSDFKNVTVSDIREIRGYFENFERRIEENKEYYKFDFDYNSQIKEGDYFRIVIKDGYQEYGYYDVYYVDVSKCTLYFIRSDT
ncbi:MAG: hypothetical protein ACOYJX_00675 [Acutalibacteraceae bacterium]|jgi:hypothetical protein